MAAGKSGTPVAVRIGWHAPIPASDRRTAKALADLLAAIVAQDESYISHGEYLEGLSPDGKRWSPDLAARYRTHLRAMLIGKDKTRRLAEARSPDGELAGLAIVAFEENGAELCWIIEDLAVHRDHRRSGVGRSFVDFIAAEASTAGASKLMLESGAGNHAAHALFDSTGFEVFSKVFMRDL